AGRRRESGGRPRARCRRLCDQAVLPPRAGGPGEVGPAPGSPGRVCSRPHRPRFAPNRPGRPPRRIGRRRCRTRRSRVRPARVSRLKPRSGLLAGRPARAGAGLVARVAGPGHRHRPCQATAPEAGDRFHPTSAAEDRVGGWLPVRSMSRRSRLFAFVGATVAVAVMALAVAEAAMDMSPAVRRLMHLMCAAMVAVTVGLGAASLRWAPRLSSLVTSLRLVAVAAVVVAAGVVAVAALTMFIEPHDLTLVLVALLLGVGLGSVLALAVAGSLTSDLARLAATARAVGEGSIGRAVGEGSLSRAVGGGSLSRAVGAGRLGRAVGGGRPGPQ